ncbi:MAG: hypothetical protein H0T14_04825 [Nocardioidaceae bacterium]|nr:hypothetical protein [Nocardioidaceae bacterium]
MDLRRFMQVTAGVVAGAALVGVPTWAVGGQDEDDAKSASDTATMMSDSQGQTQMMDMMSEMMSDPKMRRQMRSMMSDAMGQMHGMGDQMGERGSGMGQLHGMSDGSKSSR